MSNMYPHRHDAKARVYTDGNGLTWVTHAELLANEYESLEDFSIVYLNGKFYELQGYAEEPQAWWIDEVPVEDLYCDCDICSSGGDCGGSPMSMKDVEEHGSAEA